jgi:hypothetical protein
MHRVDHAQRQIEVTRLRQDEAVGFQVMTRQRSSPQLSCSTERSKFYPMHLNATVIIVSPR